MAHIMEVTQLKNENLRFQRQAIFILQKKKKRKKKRNRSLINLPNKLNWSVHLAAKITENNELVILERKEKIHISFRNFQLSIFIMPFECNQFYFISIISPCLHYHDLRSVRYNYE